MKKIAMVLVSFLAMNTLFAQREIPLYSNGVPNSKGKKTIPAKQTNGFINDIFNPTVTVFTPVESKNTGCAIVICPGGGYGGLAINHEGFEVAKLCASWGITAFVLKYRLPDDSLMVDKSIGPLQDAQRAIQLVRERAAEWGIDTSKVGIMGFSAGGHLASTASTHFNMPVIENKKDISLRPDFSILCYAVISFSESITHNGSKSNLIGKNPSADKVKLFSNELQVTPQTPPAFLVHSTDDKVVSVINSLSYYEALLKNNVLSEMHIYPAGGHGYGLRNPTTPDVWSDRLYNWLKANNWVN